MSNFVYDTFEDTNGTALTAHTGQTGATWTAVPSGDAGIAEIESNSVIASNPAEAACYASGTPATANYSVTGEINITTASSAVACGPLARCSPSAHDYYAVAWDAGTLYLYSVVAGAVTVFASGSLSLTTGTNYWLRITVTGSTPTIVTAYSSTDGVTFTQQLQYSDSSPITAAGFAGLAANTGISILSITATNLTTTIAVNDANWWRTPLAYYVDGSTSAICNVPGNESRLKVGPTANGTLTLNCSAFSTGTLQVVYSVDDGPWTAADLTSASTQIVMLSAGSSGTHTFRWKLQSVTGSGVDRWTTPDLALVETGFMVDSGAATSSWPPTATHFMLSYGDSLCEGANINNTNGDLSSQDATLAYSNHVAAAFNANLCLRGLGGGGWVDPNNGNVPPMFTPLNDTASCWDKYFAGQSLLSGGTYTTEPDWILCEYGTNDAATSQSTSAITASVSGWLAAARTAAPSAYLFVIMPFDLCNSSSTSGSAYVAAILAGIGSNPVTFATLDDMTIYQSATDTKVFCLNLGANLAAGMYDNLPGATAETNDGTHATVAQSGIAGARIVRCMQRTIAGNSSSGGAPAIGGHVSRRV